jgi:hypothetical protein
MDTQAAVKAVSRACRSVREAQERLERSVVEARAAGATWSQIGDATGMSRQSAHERWGHIPRAGCPRQECDCTEHGAGHCPCGHGPGRGRGAGRGRGRGSDGPQDLYLGNRPA